MNTTCMQALWLEENRLSMRTGLAIPKPGHQEALVRVRLAGICATDLEMVKGYYPFTGILGHEFVGEVVEAGGAPELIGQRVVGEINIACGRCANCRRGHLTHCENRNTLGMKSYDGAFADYLRLPIENLHVVPDEIPDELAVFTEPLAAALEIQQQIQILPDALVILVGAGRLGQLIAQTLVLTGCDLRVVVRHERQRQLLAPRHIHSITADEIPDRKADIVIEATGSPAGFELARRAVRPRGTMVLKSTYQGDLTANLSAVVVDEITLVGSRCGPFAPALRLLAAGLVDPAVLIYERFKLLQGLAAMECAARPEVLKVLIEP